MSEMDAREKWVYAIKFLKSKSDPGELRRAHEWEKLSTVLHYVREGIPNHYAMTDRVMYKAVMEQIIELRIHGWASERWKMYDEYAADPDEFERMRQYWKTVTVEQYEQDYGIKKKVTL